MKYIRNTEGLDYMHLNCSIFSHISTTMHLDHFREISQTVTKILILNPMFIFCDKI